MTTKETSIPRSEAGSAPGHSLQAVMHHLKDWAEAHMDEVLDNRDAHDAATPRALRAGSPAGGRLPVAPHPAQLGHDVGVETPREFSRPSQLGGGPHG
ncbi:MAG: hypothetical protein WD225_09700 [Ilumatobacteraceae bacterium]